MKILFLGPKDSAVRSFIESFENDSVEWYDQPLSETFVEEIRPDFLVSHGYRHRVRPPVLKKFPRAAINLHISYLPWNRGADPNFWSFYDDTPKGVSIHLMDERIDTGEIIAQKHVDFIPPDTLATSYQKLQAKLLELFSEEWPKIKTGRFHSTPQMGPGSRHWLSDRQALADVLELGWDTLAADITAYGKALRASSSPSAIEDQVGA